MSLPNSPPSSSTTAVVTPLSSSPESQSIHTSNAENTLPKQPHTTTVPQPQTLDSNSGLINSDLGNIDVNKTEESGEPVEPQKPEKIVNVETVTVAGIVDENRITANLSSVPTAGSLPENRGSHKSVTGPECGPGIGKNKKIVKRVVKVVKKVMKRVPKKVLVHESINPGIMVNAEESEVTEISSFDNNEIKKSNSVDELNDKPSLVNEANAIPNIAENLNLVNDDVIENTSIVNEVVEKINITNDRRRESELVSSAGRSVLISGETLRLDFGASDQRVSANDQSSINARCTDNVKSCNDEIMCDPELLEVENVNHIAKNVMETDIFVGGLDKNKTRRDDIRKVFEEVGLVLEVRLMGYPNSVKKNRGFAFVRFATAADANNALAKCSNVEICAKQCSVAPVGIIQLDNIRRNWRPGYVEKLLKLAGIEKILKHTRKKKRSFLEFETREDAHIAFNKLRKKDAFGENPMVEVEWAEPLIEPIVIPNIAENLNVANEIMKIVNNTDFLDRKPDVVNDGETSELELGEIPRVLDSMEVERVAHIAENVMETDIFVGGFHREKTNEDDIRKVFEEAGVVLEVRLIMCFNSVKKNRGFAFVRFATAADAKNALVKCSNVEICGKQCIVAPVGKICLAGLDRTWETNLVTRKNQKKKIVTLLEKAGIENIKKVTCKNQKKSSSAFLEFETSEDAQIAFNKLRKNDAFGKNSMVVVEWAEPVPMPDHLPMSVPVPVPEPMHMSARFHAHAAPVPAPVPLPLPAHEPMPMSVPVPMPEPMPMSVPERVRDEEENFSVKSVYAEYLPYSWDEENVREYFKRFGEIDNVVLATDLSSCGRKDSAFIHYTNHDAALRCIEVVGRKKLGDHSQKGMIAVSLANLNPTSKPMECIPDRTSKQLPIAKPETKQNTVWSKLGTRDTEQSLPIFELSANEPIVIPNIVENLNVANEIMEIVNNTNFLDRKPELVSSGETSKLEFSASEQIANRNDEMPCVLDSMEVERVDHIAENVVETDIFVGGFHRDKTNEDDIRKVFEEAGVVLEVRLIMFSNSTKNRGFAFVRFATAADAKNALAKCSNVEICGKQCSVAPVGKICLDSLDRNWETDYVVTLLENAGIEKIIKVTRKKKSSSAFFEFETIEDAHIAFNKLRKKDVFGKNPMVVVEWAVPVPVPEPMPITEPLPLPVPKPDEEENLSVKSVYAEYLPYSWDKENVREYFKRFGEIDNVVLATHLSPWGRIDSALIHYTNRDAALRCIEVVGKKRSGDHSPKGMIAVSLANLNPTSKLMECTPDRTSKQLPKAKPETKQNTLWSRLRSRDTEQSLPLFEISSKLHDRLGPVPLKRTASSSDRVSPAKKPKGPPRSTPPASPTCPSITTGVLNITDGEIAATYIQSLCPSPDRLTLEKLGDTELINSYCLDHSKAMAKLSVLVSRSQQGYTNTELTNELSSLKKDSAKLRSEVEESQTLVRRWMDVASTFQTRVKSQEEKIKNLEDENGALRAGMDKLQAECTERIDKARAEGVRAGHQGFPESKDGLALIQSVREITKRAFLRSGEFWTLFVKGAMFYYSYALDKAEKWASSKGFNEKFEREGPLREAPDPPFVEFCKEDNRVNFLEPEAFAAHILLQVKRE